MNGFDNDHVEDGEGVVKGGDDYDEFFGTIWNKMTCKARSRFTVLETWSDDQHNDNVAKFIGDMSLEELRQMKEKMLEECENDDVLAFLVLMKRFYNGNLG